MIKETLRRNLLCVKFFLDAFDPNSGYVVGNASQTCLAITAASLKSVEMLCAFEYLESKRFPLTSTTSNFFGFSVWQTICTKSILCWLLSSSKSHVKRCCSCNFGIMCLFCWVTGAFSSFVRGQFGHSVSLTSSLFCVGCFASAPRVGTFT